MNFYKFREANFYKFLIVILVLVFALPNFQGLARTPLQERQALKEELRQLEKQIAQYEADITKTEQEKRTLRNRISISRSKIRKLDLQIHQGNVMIKDLSHQIKDTESSITRTSLKIEDSKDQLTNVLQLIYQEDQRSLVEILLSGAELSDFFNNLVAFEALTHKNREFLEDIKGLKLYLENQKQALSSEKGDLQRIAAIQALQKAEGERTKREQERFLRLTEAEYQKYLRGKEKVGRRVAEVRARLFELIGVPEAPTFGEALDLAKWVQEQQTGIRPAFLLAIITQESALGRNVGQCYLPRPPAKNRIMHPTRDVPPFLEITRELGRDPYKTLVSCPMAVGWGGAMGPAQFIPSTWMNRRHILEPFVEGIPNPWDIRHSFLASALYLRDLGGQTNERRAALQYFAGGNWANPRFAWYGNQVVKRINCLQVFIDHGTMTRDCEGRIFIPR